jgi:hypothetical protein
VPAVTGPYVLSLVASVAAAHALTESTARLSLRDGHFELSADVDLMLLADLDATAVATASTSDLVAAHARLRQALESQTALVVDGVKIPLRLTAFPEPTQLQVVAAALSAEGRSHGGMVRIVFDSETLAPAASAVALSLSPALGPVVVSLVQPTTRYAPPGQPAVFALRPAPTRSTAALVALAMGVGLLATLAQRRVWSTKVAA